MVLNHMMKTAIVTIAFSLGITLSAEAFPAVIVGEQAGTDVIMRAEPSSESEEVDYGTVGDAVDILDNAIGIDGYTWYYVELSGLGIVGWIRGDYIALEDVYPAVESEDNYYELSEDAWDNTEEDLH
jgi:uncharacterized protein YraI